MRYFIVFIFANMIYANGDLDTKCLSCHIQQKIPSSMIYKKYLLKYSTKENISKAMYDYLKAPSKDISIMPKPFFDKFPIKSPITLDDKQLKDLIMLYIDKYDLTKKLVLEK